MKAAAPIRAEHGDRRLHDHPDVAGMHRYRERLGGRQARPELAVDQQRPDVAERYPADQILDVDTAIAECAAFPVRFRDLGLEGDHALQPRLEIGHLALLDRQGRRLCRWCSRYLAWPVTTCASSPP